MSLLRPALLLLVAVFLVCLPRAELHDWTGTEGRRVQIASEMVASGDWMVPQLGNQPTFAKPPLHYWLVAASISLFGEGYFAARIPSMLVLWLTGLLAFGLHRRAFGVGAAWTASLGVICAPLVVVKFPTAEIDPLFACLTAASLWLLAFGVARERRDSMVFAGVFGGLAFLTKGPVYFVFAAGAFLVWWRHRSVRGLLAYLLPLIAVPLLYFVPLLSFCVGWDEFVGVANTETVGRMSSYKLEHILALPGFWVRALLVQLPLVLWCFWEFRSTRDARMGPEDLTLRMCSGAAVFAVVVLSLWPGKPTRYLLPNIPLFLFAVAPAAAHYARQTGLLGRFSRNALRVIGLAGALALLAVPLLPAAFGMRSPAMFLVVALLPFLVRTPRALVAMCLWLPVAVGWTIYADYLQLWRVGHRCTVTTGPVVAAEFERLGLTSANSSSWGHFDSGIYLSAGLSLPGDELCREQPSTEFLVTEASPELPEYSGYVERVRICTPRKIFVIEERKDR